MVKRILLSNGVELVGQGM